MALAVSIIIPAYNEETTIVQCIQKAKEGLQNAGVEGQILVADNNSTDRTKILAEQEGVEVLSVPVQGYGSACYGGLMAATGDILILGDADDTYDFRAIDRFIQKIEDGYDLVIGNRFAGTIEQGAMPFLHRYLGTPVLTFCCNMFFGTRIGDVNGGMRAIRRSVLKDIELRTIGMEFASEMIIQSAKSGLRITDVPCDLAKDRRATAPHLRTWRDGWRHLRFMLLLVPRWLFLSPGLFLTTFGSLGIVVQLLNDMQVVVTPTVGERHTVSMMLCIVLGWSILQMYQRLQDAMRIRQCMYDLDKSLLSSLGAILCSAVIFAYLLFSYTTGTVIVPLNDAARFDFAMIASTLFIIGFQNVFFSFFLSILAIRMRDKTTT
ncbi:MAG: glycosyltransferase family 2 protein [bacterium]|nr:glycosyltransferase family 2 protein [bacterium]